MIRRHLSRKQQENERGFSTRNVRLNLPLKAQIYKYTISVYLSIKDMAMLDECYYFVFQCDV